MAKATITFADINVTVTVPAAAGVPVMCPVAVSKTSPAGRPAALKLVGLWVAII